MLNTVIRQLTWMSIVVVLTVATGIFAPAQTAHSEPFEFFKPWIVVSESDRESLDRDQVLVRTLPGKDGQLAVLVATRLNAQPDALVAWTRAIAELKRSRFVLAIGRFSDPPRLSDLDTLALDQPDLDAIQRCRPTNCGLRLSAVEIKSLTTVVATAGTEWRDAVQHEFRRLLIERIKQYRAGGLAALSPPADRKKSRRLDDVFTAIVEQSPYLTRLPDVIAWLKEYPHADSTVESFFYWSKEHYGEGKPVISVTHVGIVRPESDHRLPAIIVSGKQIFATHYVEGGLGLTMVLRDTTSGTPYLAYVNRSQVDLLRGFFGGLVRELLEDRVERQAPQIMRALRARLESGQPPNEHPDPFVNETPGAR